MLETIAYVVFFVLAIGIILLKNWAIRGWPKDSDGDGSEADGDARSDPELEGDR